MKDSKKILDKTTLDPITTDFLGDQTSMQPISETTFNIFNTNDNRTSLISRDAPEQTTHAPSTGMGIKLTTSATATPTIKVKKHTSTFAITPKVNSTFEQTTTSSSLQTTNISIDEDTSSTKMPTTSFKPNRSTVISTSRRFVLTGKTLLINTRTNRVTAIKTTEMTNHSSKNKNTKSTRVSTTDKTSNHPTLQSSNSFTTEKSITKKNVADSSTRQRGASFTKKYNITSSVSYVTPTTSTWANINQTTTSFNTSVDKSHKESK